MDGNQSEDKHRCCSVNAMCGRSLRQGVLLVGVSVLVVSLISFLLATSSVLLFTSTSVHYNYHPLEALDFVFALVVGCLSVYQIIISALLLWHTLRTKSSIFLCSVWYISHLSILTIYFLLFAARILLCFVKRQYFAAILTLFVAAIYEGTFIYFTLVVKSYMCTAQATSN